MSSPVIPPSDDEDSNPEKLRDPGRNVGMGRGKHARKIQNARKQWLQGALAMKTLVVGVHCPSRCKRWYSRKCIHKRSNSTWDGKKKIPVQEGV
jgi:hypothetical protein